MANLDLAGLFRLIRQDLVDNRARDERPDTRSCTNRTGVGRVVLVSRPDDRPQAYVGRFDLLPLNRRVITGRHDNPGEWRHGPFNVD